MEFIDIIILISIGLIFMLFSCNSNKELFNNISETKGKIHSLENNIMINKNELDVPYGDRIEKKPDDEYQKNYLNDMNLLNEVLHSNNEVNIDNIYDYITKI